MSFLCPRLVCEDVPAFSSRSQLIQHIRDKHQPQAQLLGGPKVLRLDSGDFLCPSPHIKPHLSPNPSSLYQHWKVCPFKSGSSVPPLPPPPFPSSSSLGPRPTQLLEEEEEGAAMGDERRVAIGREEEDGGEGADERGGDGFREGEGATRGGISPLLQRDDESGSDGLRGLNLERGFIRDAFWKGEGLATTTDLDHASLVVNTRIGLVISTHVHPLGGGVTLAGLDGHLSAHLPSFTFEKRNHLIFQATQILNSSPSLSSSIYALLVDRSMDPVSALQEEC